jgi:predicted DNA-binding transcriptional regulator AlpA
MGELLDQREDVVFSGLSIHVDSKAVGRVVDINDLIDVGEVAAILGLAQKNSVTTYMRRYGDFPAPAIEFAEGKCRAWVRADIESWHNRREEHI